MARPEPTYCGGWPGREYTKGHKGLWFTRFFNAFERDWGVDKNDRTRWLKSLSGPCGDRDALRKARVRQLELAQALGGASRTFKTRWHFVTGLGMPHVVENGFAWHPTLGTPYLCGAAVKGLLKAWIETQADLKPEECEERTKRWLGEPDQAGSLIFFDAIPTKMPAVGRDVMTPHMGGWYERGGKTTNPGDAKDVDPADWHSPIPVEFLVVREDASFLFSLAPRDHRDTKLAEDAMDALEQALEELGAGAKTAVGYGDMTPADLPDTTPQKAETHRLHVKRNPGNRELSTKLPDGRNPMAYGEEADELLNLVSPEVIARFKSKSGKKRGVLFDVTIEPRGASWKIAKLEPPVSE